MVKQKTGPIRFAVVGCGRVSPRHFHSLQTVSGASLVAVCDIRAEVAQKTAAEYHVPAYTDFSQLLKNPEVDAVALCTPSGLHPILGEQAAKAHKHVLVEKPIAVTVQAADRLIKACRSANVKLAVVLQNRFNMPMVDVKKVLEQKQLGQLFLATVCVRWFRPQSYHEGVE